jgi:SAM-dependent methyltransferase
MLQEGPVSRSIGAGRQDGNIGRVRADHELNRASWDQLAAIHGQDSYYDADALCAGGSSWIAEEEAALEKALGSQLAGKRILHLQCHLGFDAITLARRGACVTGVDFSTVALGKARALAARCGVAIDWICADVLDLPRSLRGSFDLVWATMGVLCWIGDVSAWMRETAAVLAPGGKLVLIDGVPGAPPCGPGEPGKDRFAPVRRVLARGRDYATPAQTGPQVQFQHSREAILDAATSAGLRVTHVEEHTSISSHLCISGLSLGTDGRFRRAGSQEPILFTLLAERRAPAESRRIVTDRRRAAEPPRERGRS